MRCLVCRMNRAHIANVVAYSMSTPYDDSESVMGEPTIQSFEVAHSEEQI